MDSVQIIAACTGSSTTLLVCIQPPSGVRLIQLADISSQEEERRTTAVLIAPSCSNIALITNVNVTEHQVECYQLPKSAWEQELVPHVSNSSGKNITGTNSTTDMVFSKPSHLFSIHPPKPLIPCTSNNQHAALLNVFGSREVIATGEHHILTETYLKNRRRAFESRRSGFAQEPAPTTTKKNIPTCHFLYFKNGAKQDEPCYLSVWWKTHTQLLLYSLTAKGSTPVLERVITQGSCVCVTAVSHCGRYLAIGLQSGIIVTWDLKTNFCRSVQQVVPRPDIPTALMFYTTPSSVAGAPTLAVGTNRGSVLLVRSDLTTVSLNQRVSKQQEAHKSLFESSGYDSCGTVAFSDCPALPSVVVSVHVDGSLILWSMDDLEALCKVVLPSSSSSTLPVLCTLTDESVFLSGILAQSFSQLLPFQCHDTHSTKSEPMQCSTVSCVRYLHLPSVEHLKKYLPQTSADPGTHNARGAPGNFMDNIIQNRLMEINTKIFEDNELFQARRQSKWDEFAQLLQVA